MRCDCGGKFYSLEVRPYKEIKEKITELEIKLYAVRKAVME